MSTANGKFALTHHFSTPEQQLSANKLGMWVFLAQEVMFFSGVFCMYLIWRWLKPEVFVDASQFLDVTMGATNTVVLLFSSLTAALAIRAAQTNKQGQMKMYLFVTVSCAVVFLVIKYFEYAHKIEAGLLPGQHFKAISANIHNPEDLQQFFGLYFTITGLHGIHIIIGIGVYIWMIIRAMRGEFGPHNYAALEMTGLYWHIVDIIWIFLFPLLYLIH